MQAGDTAKDIAVRNGFKDIAQMIPDASSFSSSPKKVILLIYLFFCFRSAIQFRKAAKNGPVTGLYGILREIEKLLPAPLITGFDVLCALKKKD